MQEYIQAFLLPNLKFLLLDLHLLLLLDHLFILVFEDVLLLVIFKLLLKELGSVISDFFSSIFFLLNFLHFFLVIFVLNEFACWDVQVFFHDVVSELGDKPNRVDIIV